MNSPWNPGSSDGKTQNKITYSATATSKKRLLMSHKYESHCQHLKSSLLINHFIQNCYVTDIIYYVIINDVIDSDVITPQSVELADRSYFISYSKVSISLIFSKTSFISKIKI